MLNPVLCCYDREVKNHQFSAEGFLFQDRSIFPRPQERIVLGLRIKDHNAHRRGIAQGFQTGPCPLLVPVRVGIGDGGLLGGEQHQNLLDLLGELVTVLFPSEEEGTYMHAAVTHRFRLDSLR